jgi:type II restriction enzyme
MPPTASTSPDVRPLLQQWRDDPEGTYRTWFLWEARLKNFRSIRTGIEKVVEEIKDGSFGSAYKGSSLETVVGSIAEQRQVFRGADHAFLWKPKLRIPDIYENKDNQRAFASFLDTCACCTGEHEILAAVHALDQLAIKGLGPAAANILYFLHPTLVPPSNTAIVEGYNLLMGAKVKLGRWQEYLAMRAGVLKLNAQYSDLLSNDLGAIAGFLFDIGSGRYAPPAVANDPARLAEWQRDLDKVRATAKKAAASISKSQHEDETHAQVQGWLRDLGLGLGYAVWIAANDRNRTLGTGRLGDGCLGALPATLEKSSGAEAVRLIDVLWLDKSTGKVAAAFEVEHTTSIYSGVVRLLDLALGGGSEAANGLFLVAPDDREDDCRAQLKRPAFSRVADMRVRYLRYSDLRDNREQIVRFGQGMKPIEALARALT